MKSLMNKIDRFCYRHPRFGIPNLMLYIVIGNVIVWLFSIFEPGILFYLSFSPYHILHGQVWRLFSYVLIPESSGRILFFVMAMESFSGCFKKISRSF